MKFKNIMLLLMSSVVFFSCKQTSTSNEDTTVSDYNAISMATLSTEKQNNFYEEKLSSQIVVEPGYYVWGLSVVEWEGKFHAYYSRWAKKYEHKGWMTNCEIAHAVSDSPKGPFKFQNVVLSDKKIGGWDVNNSHNPYAIVAQGKIHLYYIANNITKHLEKKNGKTIYPTNKWFEENRTLLRESQCIGVASAENPAGPFIRAKHVVVEPDNTKFRKIAVNPAVIFKDGLYYMIMKGDDMTHKAPFRIQLVGTSTRPEGPFEFSKKPVYAEAQTEDACFWYDQVIEKFFMVCHVMGKSELALFSSKNGFDWTQDERKIFMPKEFVLSDGSIWQPKRVERPFVLTNSKGQPTMIYIAVYDKNVNGNIALPIELKPISKKN